MGILNKIKTKLRLAKNKVKGRKYTSLQKPVQDMTYEEVSKELAKKEKVIFSLDNNFEGRNFELIKKFLIENRKDDFKIDYLVKIQNNSNIAKSVKINFIEKFISIYQESELFKLLNISVDKINDNTKRLIVRLCVEKLPEDLLLKYFDYTYIELGYLRKLLNRISIDGKITILNNLNNKKVKEKLFLEEVDKLDFNCAKKLYEKVILFGYEDIENFYIKKIKSSNSENVYNIINQIEYISPNLAKEFDKLIEHKNPDEVIDYINNNDVKKGGIIYLNRMFSFDDKKKVFSSLKKEEDRKNALVIFTGDVNKSEFIQMIKEEKSENIKTELLHNMPMLLKEKDRFFSEVEIWELF